MAGFDLVTHKRNKKGIIISTNPYRLHIKGNSWKYERPPGSGNMYSGAGDLMEGPLKDKQDGVKVKAQEEKEALEKLVVDVKKEETIAFPTPFSNNTKVSFEGEKVSVEKAKKEEKEPIITSGLMTRDDGAVIMKTVGKKGK